MGIAVTPALAISAMHSANRNRDVHLPKSRSFEVNWGEAVGCSPRAAVRLWTKVIAEIPPVRLWSVANPDALLLLNQLDRSVPRYVITNSEGDAHHELRACGLRHLVDGVLDSTQLGIKKPDLRIFQMGAVALGVPLDRCIYISDTLDAPTDANVRTILYDPFGVYSSDDRLRVEARITSLTELLSIGAGS
jgi:putative hydrolase of the HAD superfamily